MKKSSASWVTLHRPLFSEPSQSFGAVGFKFYKRFDNGWCAGEVVEVIPDAGELKLRRHFCHASSAINILQRFRFEYKRIWKGSTHQVH
jgi:hypothetical protein